MATDLERLVVSLSADIKKFENAMNRAVGISNRRMGEIQRKVLASNSAIAASFAKTGAQIAVAFVSSAAIRAMAQLSDTAIRIDNSLKIAGVSAANLENVYSRLSDAAKANGAPVEALVGLYSKVSLVQKELNVSSDQLIKFSGNVALALRVAGSDAQQASGALTQLAQALGGGVVRAEEFNSILEGAPTIARAVAAGLQEADGSVSKLRNLMLEGKVSSEAFFRAFEAGAPVLQNQAAGAVLTMSQATTNLETALIDIAREFNNSTGAGQRFAEGLDAIANRIASFDVAGFIQKLRDARSYVDQFLNGVGNAQIWKDLNEAMGVTVNGEFVNFDKKKAEAEAAQLEREIKLLQATIEKNTSLGFDNSEALARLSEVQASLASVKAAAAAMPETADLLPNGSFGPVSTNSQMGGSTRRGGARRRVAKPVSLSDYQVPASGNKKSSARINDYERELQQINERTIALRAETAAQAALNPLVDDYGLSAYRMQAAQDLLTAAQHAGTAAGKELTDVQQLLSGDFSKLTPQARAQAQAMLDMAGKYGLAVQASNRLAEAQDEIRQKAENALNTAKDVTRGLIDDFTSGTSAAETFANALKKIGDTLIDDVLSSVFSLKSATSGNWLSGLFGGLFGGSSQFAAASAGKLLPGLFAEGGYTGNGGKYDPAGIVHRGEYVFDQEAVRAAGGPAALEAMRKRLKGYSGGGYVGAVAPRLPDITAARAASAAPAGGAIHIDVTGARGNAEIQDMVAAGVQKGIAAYDKQMPGRVQQIQQSPRFRG